ncbi:hypothetical protein C8F04DRAFT_1087784 [Mycena alexandri]|uniref:Uncharacterized protein n=1 Tax=Mycena alexandri TaxID=1745969 RepID=A0AAD6T7P8_9AGAR|nr:hypothetical protein C8F04DRAFT_1087784 [Mycena alexandri]
MNYACRMTLASLIGADAYGAVFGEFILQKSRAECRVRWWPCLRTRAQKRTGEKISHNIWRYAIQILFSFVERQVRDLYRHSPMLIVYTYAYCYTEFGAARNYFESVFQHAVDEFECTLWVHRSTGRLCMDLVPGEEYWGAEVTISSPNRIESLDAANHEAMIINALTLDQYHRICYYELSQTREISISTSPMVNLGAVISSSSGTQLEDFLEIAFLPIAQRLADEPRWIIARGSDGDLMEDGWTRFTPTDAADNKIKLSLNTHDTEHWLSQANNVFSRLGISSNYEDYVVVTEIAFTVLISAATVDPPKGHLFLCPPKDLQTGASAFRWPDCPAYWSLDPSGVKHLSVEDPTKLSFPSIQFSMEIWGWFWDASVYTGLWQFHKAKGFDPDTQAIAQHLEESLYQLSSERDIPFAHIDGAESCDGDNHGPVTTATESEGSRKTSGGNHVASATLINHLEHASPPEETENSNTLQQVDARSSTSKDYLLDVKRIPLKRFAEQINTPQQAVIRASPQDDLTLRRLILDEKAQILEMYRLGIYTKEEVIAQLAQIETRCEVAAIRPPPAKRLRLSDSSGAGSFGDVETGDI